MSIKSIIKNIIGDKNLGRIDYFFKPEYKNIWGGAFNGQEFRRKIFTQLCSINSFSLIVETGSFRGNTTLFMSKQDIPIKTVEYDLRVFGYVSTRFLFNSKISTYKNDSRSFLNRLARDKNVAKANVFFYLDAHWNDDLPLAEELSIIFSHWKDWVIMIDDFRVPGTSYDYDDYGEGKALTLDYVNSALEGESYWVYFPSVDETQETGFKRGCAVLCNSQLIADKLEQCDTLTRWSPSL